MSIKRLAANAVRSGASMLRLPHAWSGYRLLGAEELLAYAHREEASGAAASVRTLFPPATNAPALPRNIGDVRELPRLQGRWSRSFAEVATRTPEAVSIVNIPDCRILAVQGEWGLEHFSILSRSEDLSFSEQVSLFAEARVVVSLHGAGLSNIIFAPPAAHVVEIADPSHLDAAYYGPAAAAGHHYWLLFGEAVGTYNPGYHDLYVKADEVLDVAARIERELAYSPV